MLRLMGLPALTRCPRATVRRAEGRIELRFHGPESDQAIDIDLGLLGEEDDPEAEELRLLAELEARGYAVERLAPDDAD